MKNLENYGVLELSTLDKKNINGGDLGWGDWIAIAELAYDAISYAVDVIAESGQQPGANGYMGSKI